MAPDINPTIDARREPDATPLAADPAALRREIDELRSEVVRLEQELGVERGERTRLEARAVEETLRANAGWLARDRVATSTAYRVGRLLTRPVALLRRIAARLRRR